MRTLALAAVLSLSTLAMTQNAKAQKAAFVVQERVDIDGDGKQDLLGIDETGVISAHVTAQPKASGWMSFATSGQVVSGTLALGRGPTFDNRIVILAQAELRTSQGTSREAALVAWTPGRLTPLWRGPVGATDADGEAPIKIELRPAGVLRYHSRVGVFRCDGKAAELAAEAYDFHRGQFRAVRQHVRIADGAQTLRPTTTRAPASPVATSLWFHARGASSSLQASTVAELVAPIALTDGDLKTAWVENKGGFGRGEFVTLTSTAGPVAIRAIRLVGGHGADATRFNRPKRLGLVLGKDAENAFWLELPSDPQTSEQWFELPAPVTSTCATFILDDVYPSTASRSDQGRTAISEITVITEDDLDPLGPGRAVAERIASGQGKADTARLVTALGPSAEVALTEALARQKSELARHRLRMALARIPAAPAELVQALVASSLSESDLEALRTALSALKPSSIAAVGDLLARSDLGDRRADRADRWLVEQRDPEALDQALALVGTGDPRRRRQHVELLAAARAVEFDRIRHALDQAGSAERRADLWSLVGLVADDTAQLEERARALAVELDRGNLAYELHYRLLQGACALGHATATAACAMALDRLQSAKDVYSIALRRIALEALARNPRAEAQKTLSTAITDTDPGARQIALGHLGRNPRDEGAAIATLAKDGWPQVRRAAALALGNRCESQLSTAALDRSVRKDLDAEVARAALTGLLGCNARAQTALLFDLLADRKRPLELRQHAARAVGEALGDHDSTRLIQLYRSERQRALSDSQSIRVVAALTVSLAQVGGQAAVESLESTAADAAFPELQTAALAALGELCPAGSRPVVLRLQDSAEHTVSQAARRAAETCGYRKRARRIP